VAALQRDGGRLHPFGGVPLYRWRDRLVVLRYHVPRWFLVPSRRLADLIAKATGRDRPLRSPNHPGFLGRQVLHKVLANALQRESDITFAIGFDLTRTGCRRLVAPPVLEGLAAVWRTCGDVYEPSYFGMVPRLGNDCAAPRVSD
jgi:hypothetical protein